MAILCVWGDDWTGHVAIQCDIDHPERYLSFHPADRSIFTTAVSVLLPVSSSFTTYAEDVQAHKSKGVTLQVNNVDEKRLLQEILNVKKQKPSYILSFNNCSTTVLDCIKASAVVSRSDITDAASDLFAKFAPGAPTSNTNAPTSAIDYAASWVGGHITTIAGVARSIPKSAPFMVGAAAATAYKAAFVVSPSDVVKFVNKLNKM